MIELFSYAVAISFICGSLTLITEYVPNEPKRNQMLLYFVKKWIYQKREKVLSKRDADIKSAQEYFRNEINNLKDDEWREYKFNAYERKELAQIEMIQNRAEKELSYEWYLKPIILCVYCMPSFWGTAFWLLAVGFERPIDWILTLVISVFINAFIWNLYLKLDR